MRKRPKLLVGSVITGLFLPLAVQAQSHVLYGDLIVHEEKAPAAGKSSIRLTLTSLTGTVIGRQTVSNGGRYRFLSVSNGDYILTVELGSQEVARLNLLINELRATDIRRNLEFEWKNRFPDRSNAGGELVYARSAEQQRLFLVANSARSSGDLETAEELLTQLTTKDAADFKAWTELGTVRFRLNQLEGAESAYLKALSLQPKLIIAHQNLGKLYFRQEKYDQSMRELEAVIISAPEVAEAHLLLGESYLQMKRGSKAVPHLEKAVELDPLKMADAHLRLATLYRAAGYADLAVEQYRLYLQKRPDSLGRKEIEKYIQKNSSRH